MTEILVARPGAPWALAAARAVAAALAAAPRPERPTLALPGGSTPEPLFSLWRAGQADSPPWPRTTVLFGDERCVAPASAESNFGRARGGLLDRLATPAAAVVRIEGELGAEAAAARYEARLDEVLGRDGALDLALLGVGADGHTASLFPGGRELEARGRRAVASRAPVGVRDRVTLTLEELARCRRVIFLVRGSGKAEVVRRLLGPEPDRALPAARVRPAAGDPVWVLDEAAAAKL